MKINSLKEKTNLKLSFENGFIDGEMKLLNKSYSKVNPEAEDTSIYNVGVILSDLQEKDLITISKVETSILSKEE